MRIENLYSPQKDANSGGTSPEPHRRRERQEFEVTSIKYLSGVHIDAWEQLYKPECCGSFMTPTVEPAVVSVGSFHKLRVIFPNVPSLKCDCGSTVYPSVKAHDEIIKAYLPVRDFIDEPESLERIPQGTMDHVLDLEGISKINQFRELLRDRSREHEARDRRDSQR